MSLKKIAAAISFSLLAVGCSTTQQETQPLETPVEKSETGPLGEKDPVTGCRKKEVDGVVYELCPSPQDF